MAKNTLPVAKMSRIASLWDSNSLNGYSDSSFANKEECHKFTLKTLRYFAKNIMNLENSQFQVRSNRAGVAVSGEVCLYTDRIGPRRLGLFIQIGSSLGDSVLYRTTDGKNGERFDSGSSMRHHNNFVSCSDYFSSVENMQRFFDEKIVPLLEL